MLSLAFTMTCIGLAIAGPIAGAQAFDATHLFEPVHLGATWMVHAGDDPAFSREDFDDSSWTPFDPATNIAKLFPNTKPEVVWYRLHIRVRPDQTGLGLLEHQISSAFEVYVNGQRLIETGQVSPPVPWTFTARLLRPIPDSMTATGSLVLALRVHISRLEWDGGGPGYATENLMIGQFTDLKEHLWLALLTENTSPWFLAMFALGVGIVALTLFSAQPARLEYLWIFLQAVAQLAALPISVYELTHAVPIPLEILRQFLNLASLIFQLLIFSSFLRLKFNSRAGVLLLLVIVCSSMNVIGQATGTITQLVTVLAQFPLLTFLAGVFPLFFLRQMRRGDKEAGILLIPILLTSLTVYVQLFLFILFRIHAFTNLAIRWSGVLNDWKLGPFAINLQQIDNMLYYLSLAVIMVLRSTRMSRQQALMEGELAAAQQVQQVILPEQMESVPGFIVESVYQPAQQVGGDFFQVLPTPEGGMLLVVGDVAGKGLPAAMLVSLLVGAVRTAADDSHAPEILLQKLNERLFGRTSGGFSTAVAAYISPNGHVTIANAGHLSPYLDGQEVEVPGALPLGILSGAVYETTLFHLAPGSRLTFYSDGVIEAQNQKGELFGFDRGQAISTQPAAAIVEAAKQFGQSDDITVVAITRATAVAAAA